MKISEYKIVSGNVDFISERIKVLSSEGWELYGNPYYSTLHHEHCQAMIMSIFTNKQKNQLND